MQRRAHLVTHRCQEHGLRRGMPLCLVPCFKQFLFGGHHFGNVADKTDDDGPTIKIGIPHHGHLGLERRPIHALGIHPHRSRTRDQPLSCGILAEPALRRMQPLRDHHIVQLPAHKFVRGNTENERGGRIGKLNPPLHVRDHDRTERDIDDLGHRIEGALHHHGPLFQFTPKTQCQHGRNNHQGQQNHALHPELLEKRLLHFAHAFRLRNEVLQRHRGHIAHDQPEGGYLFAKAQQRIPVVFSDPVDLGCQRVACHAEHYQQILQLLGQLFAPKRGKHGVHPAVENVETQTHRRKTGAIVSLHFRIDFRQQHPVDRKLQSLVIDVQLRNQPPGIVRIRRPDGIDPITERLCTIDHRKT